MKTPTPMPRLFLLPVLTSCLVLTPAGRVAAQTFSNLYSFSATSANPPYTNTDGAYPSPILVLSGDTLYGTAGSGGTGGNGTIFAINSNGTGFTNLYSFSETSSDSPTNSDGSNPHAGLILSGDTLYGTTLYGGASGLGTVFAINTNGKGFTNLHSFSGRKTGGGYPDSSLVLSGNALYATGESGGVLGADGMVYMIYTNGSGFTNLHFFTGGTNGAMPQAGLVLSGNTLYGTASGGGSGGNGTVFVIETNGIGFTNIYSFTGSNDGSLPIAGLVLSNSTLYGTTQYGGITNNNNGYTGSGTVFSLNTNGESFTVLHTFTMLNDLGTNYDGVNPTASLILSGNTLYGTTYSGGRVGYGTLFSVETNGTNFTTLYDFTGGDGGGNPEAGLLLAGNALYGTTVVFGSGDTGTVFRFLLGSVSSPQLTIIPDGADVILTWPTNLAGFILQSTTNLSVSPVWTTNSLAPAIINGQNTVTNPISGTQQFFRLSQ
jgi:uncharacterized repeat protein (TIGR03803 family)